MTEPPSPRTSRPLPQSLVLIMAVATGVTVANLYFAQPLLPVIGGDLHMSSGETGLIITIAQLGFALGLFFLLPLGDLLERRRLVVVLSALTAIGLVVFALAGSGLLVLVAAGMIGLTAVLAQVLVPFAASMASDATRGRVVGTVMSGLLIGILLARTIAGALAATGTWRTVYLVSAGLMVVQAVVLHQTLPTWREHSDLGYGAAIRSTVALIRQEPLIRLRACFGLLDFATFSVLWTSMAYMLSARYRFGPAVIGLFGLAGAAGALTATVAGRRSDLGKIRSSTLIATTLLCGSWLLLWLGDRSLVAFVAGVVVLDIGAQGLHITNQGAIYRIRPEARSRVTSVYMVCYFIGGAAGSALSTALYQRWGWTGVCWLGAGFAVASSVLAVLAATTSLRRVEAGAATPVTVS